MMTESIPLEIERRFLIRMPDGAAVLKMAGADYTDIVQTYLTASGDVTERVRKRGKNGEFVYTHTTKVRLGYMTHSEDEKVISEAEYNALLLRADPARNVIVKRRYTVPFDGHMFEVDVYPFWHRQAVMEVELKSQDETVSLPPEMNVLREITGDRRYSNAALSACIPAEGEE